MGCVLGDSGSCFLVPCNMSCNHCTKIVWWACDSPCWGCGWSVWPDREWRACWCSQTPPEPGAVEKGCTGTRTCRKKKKKLIIKLVLEWLTDYPETPISHTLHQQSTVQQMCKTVGGNLLLSQFGPLIKPFTPWNVPHACLTGTNEPRLLTNDKLLTLFITPKPNISLLFNPIQGCVSASKDNKRQ